MWYDGLVGWMDDPMLYCGRLWLVVVEFLTIGASPPQHIQVHEPCATFWQCRCPCAISQGHVQCSEMPQCPQRKNE